MSTPTITDGGNRPGMWRAWICVLLIAFILYNPFLGLTSASNGLAYNALARHRASVGASELQHYAPVKIETAQADVNVEPFHDELVPAPQDETRLICEPGHLPLLMEGMTSIWFRPPPHP
jgi:hypothetical protein